MATAVALLAAAVVVASAWRHPGDDRPDRLALRSTVVAGSGRAGASTDDLLRRASQRHQRSPEAPIGLGVTGDPFVALPGDEAPRLIRPASGVALPILGRRQDGWLVSTACQSVGHITTGTPIARAHVVLDPGHGGVEPGAVGPGGLMEKDLNLAVARHTADLLTEAGATIVLTRDGDHTMTAAARGLVARATGPALLVSIHHNGGAEPGDGGPGTIVFTEAGSQASTRFGGLFHQALTPLLEEAATAARARHDAWNEEIERYDEARMAHHRSVAERDQALVANGQVPPSATTTVPEPTTVADGGARLPTPIAVSTTTTMPASAATTVVVPDTLAPPTMPIGEPVAPFRWAGSGNAGVRSWVGPDGQDHLAVLRHSGPSPAALVEFLYVTNPSEEALLASEEFLIGEAEALAKAITRYLTGEDGGTGFVADQAGDQPIGGSGGREDCVEPPLD